MNIHHQPARIPRKQLVALGAALATCILLSSCARKTEDLPRNETLYVAGFQFGPPTNFSPLSAEPHWPVNNATVLLYETPFNYNQITGEMEPGVALSYTQPSIGEMVVNIDPIAQWQDGTPLTAEDLKYTYDLAARYALNYASIWDCLSAVSVEDPTTVRFTFQEGKANPLLLLDTFTTVYVVPKHVFEPLEVQLNHDGQKLMAFRNDNNPIASGPYRLKFFSPQKVVLERWEEYWGIQRYQAKPAPKYVVHVVYKDNIGGNVGLERAEVDISQQFIPQVWRIWEKGAKVGTWYKERPYFVPGALPSLFINTTRFPFNQPAVRRAMAHAINYGEIAELAMNRYADPVQASLILPYGGEAKYFPADDVQRNGWSYDPEKARQILIDAGFSYGADGMLRTADGNQLETCYAECPYGWSDWMTSLEIATRGFRAIGIDVQPKYPETPIWTQHRLVGDFDLLMYTPRPFQGPSLPWSRLYEAMNSIDLPPVGENAFMNFGRYQNDRANEILAEIPKTQDETTLTQLYAELDAIFREDVPLIPLEYRPWLFHEFNFTYWTNWPTAENPLSPPQNAMVSAGVRTLFHLKPATPDQ